VMPEELLDTFANFLALLTTNPLKKKTIKIPREDDFNDHYRLVGTQRDDILFCMKGDVIDFLFNDRWLAFEISDGKLLVYYGRNTRLGLDDYEAFLEQADRLAHVLEKA